MMIKIAMLEDDKFQSLLAPRVLVALKSMLLTLESALDTAETHSLARVTCAMLHSLLDGLFERYIITCIQRDYEQL